MNTKGILSAAVFSVVLLAVASGAYAMWSDSLRVNGTVNTGTLIFVFQNNTAVWSDHGPDTNSFPPNFNPQPAPENKDVGSISVGYLDTDGDGYVDTLNITINNAYPYYYNHIGFKVCNKGSIPLKIWKMVLDGQNYYEINENQLHEGVYLDLDNDGHNDTLIWWGDNFGKQLHTDECADISLDITILQEAPQDSTLSFTIQLVGVQWNEYSSGPISP